MRVLAQHAATTWQAGPLPARHKMAILSAFEASDVFWLVVNLDALLTDTFGKEGPVRLETDGVRMSVTVTSADGTTLTDLEGHSRLSFFDRFTSLAGPVA